MNYKVKYRGNRVWGEEREDRGWRERGRRSLEVVS